MLSRSFLAVTSLFFASAASAQNLPQPAPVPGQEQANKPAAAKPKATPLPDAEVPVIIQAPPSSEDPIVIGEPIRHQGTPARAAAAKPNPIQRRAVAAGVDITGLSDGAAVRKLQAALEPKLKAPVRIVVGEYQYTFLRQELGATIPYWPLMRAARAKGAVSLSFQVDEKTAVAAMRELDGQVREDFESTGLNVGGTTARIKAALEATPPKSAVQSLVTRLEAPKPKPSPSTVAQVPPHSGAPNKAYPYLLTSFSTRYDASLRGRTTNLKMAAQNINGTVVQPGKVFSTNMAIGPRNAANGWKEAGMFVSGRVVSGTGAGICQAASTLYNAALAADFPIVERHAHSMRVMYVPPSQDAALMWGAKDFKFKNTTGAPIMVQTYVSGGKFHSRIWGTQPLGKSPVRVVSRVISTDGGTRSEAYKIIGGKRVKLSRDFYKPHP